MSCARRGSSGSAQQKFVNQSYFNCIVSHAFQLFWNVWTRRLEKRDFVRERKRVSAIRRHGKAEESTKNVWIMKWAKASKWWKSHSRHDRESDMESVFRARIWAFTFQFLFGFPFDSQPQPSSLPFFTLPAFFLFTYTSTNIDWLLERNEKSYLIYGTLIKLDYPLIFFSFSLQNLRYLRVLAIADMDEIPIDLLQSFDQLKALNVSGNHFQNTSLALLDSVSSLEVRAKCQIISIACTNNTHTPFSVNWIGKSAHDG